MSKIEVSTPNVANIVVVGPTQCGKSIVLEKIARMLKDEFGATLVNIEAEKNGHEEIDNLRDWQTSLVRNTVWILSETNVPRT